MKHLALCLVLAVAGVLTAQENPFEGRVFFNCSTVTFDDDVGLVAAYYTRDSFQSNGVYRSEDVDTANAPASSEYSVIGYRLETKRGQLFMTKNKIRYLVVPMSGGIYGLYAKEDTNWASQVYTLLSPTSFLVPATAPNVQFARDRDGR